MNTKSNLIENNNIQSTVNKFGSKMVELMEVVKKDDNWRDYVNTETVVLIEDLFKYQNLTIVAKIHNMKYISLRSKYLTACKRIKNKSKDYMRNGKSEKAQKLFGLINKLPD